MNGHIIAVANQKGGVGKSTTIINLAHALALHKMKTLVVDLDPQGNATQGLGVSLETVQASVSDLIRSREATLKSTIYEGNCLSLVPATPSLAIVERELVGLTNGELRLARRLKEAREQFDLILIDTPPTFGPLINSALNAADGLIVPVDSGYFAMMGIKELLSEIEEIRQGTNPGLRLLGLLVTMVDNTRVAAESWDSLVAGFGDLVFETRIRRSVRLKESPMFGKSIFQHAPNSFGSEDYLKLSYEVLERLGHGSIEATSRHEVLSVGGA